ncbi:MAG: hypothetical protein LIO37_05070 [Clostridiales bacterium]|nr:hypothetical protein [Clostridiales bacterium]
MNESGEDVTLQSSESRDSLETEVTLPTDKMAIVHYFHVEEILEREPSAKAMTISEKEYNGFLYDQMSLLEDIKEAAEAEGAEEKLYVIEKSVDR